MISPNDIEQYSKDPGFRRLVDYLAKTTQDGVFTDNDIYRALCCAVDIVETNKLSTKIRYGEAKSE